MYYYYCSLIIAGKFHPLPILRECLPLLGPSSPFVVYSEFMEPLAECYLYAQARGDCLRLRLDDIWLREFQTLPGRVHPQVDLTSVFLCVSLSHSFDFSL